MDYSKASLQEGIQAIASLIMKSEKALLGLKTGSAQHTLLTRRLEAFKLANHILNEKLNELK